MNMLSLCNSILLDLLLCNFCGNTSLLSFIICEPFTNTCDHCVIHFTLTFDINKPTTSNKRIPDFTIADYTLFGTHLSAINWTLLINKCNNNVQVLYDCLLDELNFVIDKYIPSKVKRLQHSKPPYVERPGRKPN